MITPIRRGKPRSAVRLAWICACAGAALVGWGLWKQQSGSAMQWEAMNDGLYAAIQEAEAGHTVVKAGESSESAAQPDRGGASDAASDGNPADGLTRISGNKGGDTALEQPSDSRIDINRATAAELDQLPGIGPAKAAAIVADRESNGPFRSADDLERVKGIGAKMVEKLRDAVVALP